MSPKRGLAVTAGLVLGLALLAAATPPGVTASHGPESANFTVEPLSDRSPGAENVRYGQRVVATAGVDLATLEETTATYEAGSFSSCGPSDGETFGIDRGDTHARYGIDEDLTDNVKSFTAREDLFKVEFYGEDDFGASTHLDDGDEFVSVSTCIDNPDQPGWYRISGTTTGVTESGDRVTSSTESHYFWICDCEDEAEARETLGPPPSEPQATATPTATPTASPGDSGADGNGDSGEDAEDDERASPQRATPTPSATTDEGAATATATAGATAAAADGTPDGDGARGPEDAGTGTPTGEWDDHVLQTPTAAEGPGFGAAPALLGILAAILVLRRRR
jgi:PGF-CTERM protein